MTRYLVEPQNPIDLTRDFSGASRDVKRQALKAALADVRTVVEAFADISRDKIEIGEGSWLATALEIETTPDMAEALRKFSGFKVTESRLLNVESVIDPYDTPPPPKPRNPAP